VPERREILCKFAAIFLALKKSLNRGTPEIDNSQNGEMLTARSISFVIVMNRND
jgi:hypothetical protein